MTSTDYSPQFNSPLNFSQKFPIELFDVDKDILIYDKFLLNVGAGSTIQKFKYSYGVTAGESLKQLSSLEGHLQHILALAHPTFTRNHRLVALGGGSVGDFVGFVASILKRGVPWVGVPTTWLAALDSAHGGKTALNFSNTKNQLGTFYPAQRVVLVEEILSRQPEARAREALGELLKMAWISGEKLYSQLEVSSTRNLTELLWSVLPEAIAAKYKVVMQDPYEKTGVRKILNLGHTLGHVIEAHFKLAHGEAVLQGLLFAVEWSQFLGHISESEKQSFLKVVDSLVGQRQPTFEPMNEAQLTGLLLADKKIEQGQTIDFILVQGMGRPFIAKFSVSQVCEEARRQGWLRD
ncbi:MAG: 3-dehydroquinate synthase [Bdellovibrionales bacterium]|nr:3-dehydroquinate synthase [Bdellovibrionales bacterium]